VTEFFDLKSRQEQQHLAPYVLFPRWYSSSVHRDFTLLYRAYTAIQ